MNIIPKFQTGFRAGMGTLNLAILPLLTEKAAKKKTRLFACFIDLKAAFDRVNRNSLWEKLRAWGMSSKLLDAIIALHSETWAKVKLGGGCTITASIYTQQGLKQGCVLAPSLFNLFLADIIKYMHAADCHPPNLAKEPIPFLQYADGIVVLSQSPIGLQRAINNLETYLDQEKLELNKEKTKVVRLVDPKKPKFKWFVKGTIVEEQASYKYLGLKLGRGSIHKEHKMDLKAKTHLLIFAYRLLYKKLGCPNHTHLLKVMAAQILPTLLYALFVWCGTEVELLNELQTKVYKAVFNLPKSASPAQVRLEFGLQNQKFQGMSGLVKLCHKFRTAEQGTLNSLCWKEIKNQMDQDTPNSWGAHLSKSLAELDIQTTWDSMADWADFGKSINNAAKKKSFLEDKTATSKRRHGWTVMNSYTSIKPQAYLLTHFSAELKKSFIDYWLGMHD